MRDVHGLNTKILCLPSSEPEYELDRVAHGRIELSIADEPLWTKLIGVLVCLGIVHASPAEWASSRPSSILVCVER